MKNSVKIAIVALAGVVALGGAAVAAKGWRHGGPHGPMGFEQLAERYDANKDGKISQEEIDTNRDNWVSEFDIDKSSSLALTEFQNLWLKANNQRMVRDFQRLDKDGNGQVTLEEYKEPMAKIVASLDQDKDGAVSTDEMRRGKHGHMRHGPDMNGPDGKGPDAQ